MKKTILIGIVGLLVIVAGLASFMILFEKVDPSLPGDDVTTEEVTNKPSSGNNSSAETNKPSGGSSSSSTTAPSTSAPSDEDSDFVVYGDVGYSTVNGYTYFFVSYTNGTTEARYWNCHDSEGNDGVKPYGIYEPYVAYSYDGETWKLDEYTVHQFTVIPEKTIYVSYTRVKNCSNPEAVLEELSDYVLYNDYYFNWDVLEDAG